MAARERCPATTVRPETPIFGLRNKGFRPDRKYTETRHGSLIPDGAAERWGLRGSGVQGGTTSTGDYNTNTEWTPATVPTAAGQSAIFDAVGPDTINVSGGIAPGHSMPTRKAI